LLAQDDGRRQRAIATVELKGQEIFAIGEWNSIEFSEADVDSIIKSFDLLELAGHIPLKLGHEGPDARDDPETQFALGWVTKLYREGKKLLADFTVPEKVAAWIRDGMLRFVSVELLKDVKADTREIPWVLDAVALLGADQPAVGILKSLSLTMARSTALQCRERVAFSRDNPTTGGHTANMAEPNDDMKALLARLTAAERKADDAEKERDTVRLTAARAEQAEAKLSELQAQTRNEKIAAHRKTLMELFEAPIKAKTILPAVREQFKRVLADVPDDADAAFAVGMLSLQINRLDEAEKYLKRALDLRPQNDQARLYIGQVLEQQKRYREAGQWYAQVSPGEYYFETQTRIGLILAKQGDLAAARKHLQSIQPESDQQRVQLALAEEQLLREAKLHREAFEILNAAERAVPGDKDLLYARALIAEKLNLLDVAERDLREILKKDPKNVNALNALGFTLADRTTRYQEAYELLQQALALKPEDPFILDSFGWVQYRLGNQAEALKHLKRALELRNDAEISAHLGEVLWVTGNRNEAESVWNRALNLTPDSETLLGVINKFREKSKE